MNHQLNYNHLFYFHVAATEGSLARAADKLGVTQPTVSEQIRQLERKLGVVLFERSTTGLRLTDVGRQAYEHTTPMFRAGERLIEILQARPSTGALSLRIGISTTVARVVAPELLTPVFGLPGYAPAVRTADLADLLRDVREHAVDIVLCESEPHGLDGRGLRFVEIHRPRLAAVAAPSTEIRDGWVDAPMVHHSAGSPFRAEIDSFLLAHDLRPTIAGETDDPGLMVEAAVAGSAIAFVPRTRARRQLDDGRLRALAVLDTNGVAVHALCHDSHAAIQAVERIQAYARDHLEA